LFGREESKANNSKVAHEYAEHNEHGEFILVWVWRVIPYVQLLA
jgi:hypothetical protein